MNIFEPLKYRFQRPDPASETDSGTKNHSRLVSITYPVTSGVTNRTLDYNFDAISRLTSIGDGTITLEAIDYLGLQTVVNRAHSQSGVDVTYVTSGSTSSDSQDQYTGIDRFERIVDQRWTASGTDKDRFKYAYDENGNRRYRTNELDHNFDELYQADGSSNGYDKLNQLVEFQRGTLTTGTFTISSETRRQVWNGDALGNFETVTTDSTTDTRTHNRQNQLTQTVIGSTTTTLAYDNAGNMIDDGPNALGYDAWNRLVTVNSSARYAYDAINRRLKEDVRAFVYSNNWQVLEERASGAVAYRYAWSPVYVDAMITRDKYVSGSMTERLYVLADANYNVTALVDTSGTVLERYVYDPFGTPTKLATNWSTYSGSDRVWVFLHQGGRWDATPGMYHFRRRDLSSVLGRWEKVDPIGYRAGDSNLVRYENNRPLASLDYLGLVARTCTATDFFRPSSFHSAGALLNLRDPDLETPAELCKAWALIQVQIGTKWMDDLPNCPCTIKVPPAANNSGTFEEPKPASQWYHPGASWCMRQVHFPMTPWGRKEVFPAGQQCCYNEKGKLITDGAAAGTPDFYAPLAGPLQALMHYLEDVGPFETCKAAGMLDVYLRYRKPNNGNNCPPLKIG